MTAVGTASLAAAGVSILMMVVAASDTGIKLQFSGQQCLYGCIRIAGHSSAQLNAGLRQRCLCSAANTSANQQIHSIYLQKSSQRSMSTSVWIQK